MRNPSTQNAMHPAPKNVQLRRRITLLGVVGLVGLATFTTVAVARPFGHGDRHPERMKRFMGHMVEDVMSDIDASDTQTAQVQDIVNAAFDDLRPGLFAQHSRHDTLLNQFIADEPNAEVIDAVLAASAEDRVQTQDRIRQALMEVHDILDAEQRAALVQELKERRGHHGGHGGPGFLH